ncbi:MAG: FtsX-like permease family protein [Bacteroidetes bacterium]|nr:MAG: FtsX-like permease family protein [Bacteroidota bacterium]
MIKNYFKIAWRNLFRNKGFSATNLLGLTIGITCTILISLWVKDELTYNKFHANYGSIYKIYANRDFNNQVFTDENMVLPLASTIEKQIPQIKSAVVTTHRQPHILTYGENKLKKEGYTVSEHFFDIFSWKFINGAPATALPDAYSIVLTQSTAKALFGNDDPINKVVKVDNEYDARVTAIVNDVPGNSTFQFDFVNAFNYNKDFLKRAMTNWQNSSWDVFVQVNPGTNMKMLEKNINDIKYQHDESDKKISTYFAFPMSKWRLQSEFKDGKNIGGMIEYVRLFSIIAIIILLIACVNFMNLSTARSEKRAREVGVRKTLGSGKRQLIFQFFSESIILTSIAFVLSVFTVYLLLPFFNDLVDKHLSLNILQPLFWIAAVALIIFTGIVAGSYPALYLSSFNPVKVLKGTFLAGKKSALPRHILVVGQFAISILLISATIIIYQQIQHIKNRDIGYNPDNLIMVPSTEDTQKNYAAIRDELMKTGVINIVNRSFSPITEIWWKAPAPDWDGKPAGGQMIVASMATDIDYAKTMGVKIIEGKDFSGVPADSSNMLINEEAVKTMQLKNPIGTQLRYGSSKYTVIGVTGNIVMESPFKAVDPMLVYFDPRNSNSINIRLKTSVKPQDALRSIEKVFKKYNPAFPFDYKFVDQEFGKKFLTENLISRITNIFAGLAIFICCIGLAGLASFTIEKRIREIGIRKVMGATLQQLLLLISKDFLKLVLIAFVIATPLAWWFMNNWLEKYPDRISISIWLFGAVGFLILLLALVVVSLNTMKAAVANPIKSLRTE